ncbi:acyl-CoA dehydrogenase family protein [Actinomycetospora sp. NBRC 106378]|uniref:acyl-CoA dehydrogenase family protein n=1 Tax=Actinomycetospora sp. NBRC 106378 TaxID=3032208 RepID=UPI0024A02E66|nr:acyl-CoA dehydrogenase family protein [Actinomycetospora sp. NBRC 106378]GLZ52550.1 acyl-CoA dehydrogenase [Actinomycetospora sp. NBRC 106378]
MSLRITPDADAEDLRAVVRDLLERRGEPSRDAEPTWDPDLWRRFAGELGVAALDVPEDFGGAGASFREVAVVAEELGRRPVRLPWFSTAVLAVGALLELSGTEDLRRELLTSLASGERTGTFAFREDHGEWDPDHLGTRAEGDDDGGWRLSGTKLQVVEGATADLLFVVAAVEGEPAVFVVDGAAEGLVRSPLRALDPNRQLADVLLDRVPARRVGHPGDAREAVEGVLRRGRAALGCEQAGGAAAAMELSVAYAADRVQFGRPIATFQAIKHRCADMAVRVEAARSASWWAAAALAERSPEAPAAVATAALVCGEAYAWVAAETVQVHGGTGFTWEHVAHLHVRRAATDAALLGARHSEALLGAIGLPST